MLPAPAESPEEKRERERELHRQRQARYADRKKAEASGAIDSPLAESAHESLASGQTVSPDSLTVGRAPADAAADTDTKRLPAGAPVFHWKLPFGKSESRAKIKLFTAKEAEEELERLTEVYWRGSGLLDDLLEIVVKDHEPVTIWQLDQEEAGTLAAMHLERAKTNEESARSARKLLEIYDRLYLYLLIGPRAKATFSHVKAHGGFSFK